MTSGGASRLVSSVIEATAVNANILPAKVGCDPITQEM